MSEHVWCRQKLGKLLKFEATGFLSMDFYYIAYFQKKVACDVTRMLQCTQTHC